MEILIHYIYQAAYPQQLYFLVIFMPPPSPDILDQLTAPPLFSPHSGNCFRLVMVSISYRYNPLFLEIYLHFQNLLFIMYLNK